MMLTYESYGKRCGRENVEKILEEEDSENEEEIPNEVRFVPPWK